MTSPTDRERSQADSADPGKRDDIEYVVDGSAQLTVEGFIHRDWRGENRWFKHRYA